MRRSKRSKGSRIRMLPGDKKLAKDVVKVGAVAIGVYAVIAIGKHIFGGK